MLSYKKRDMNKSKYRPFFDHKIPFVTQNRQPKDTLVGRRPAGAPRFPETALIRTLKEARGAVKEMLSAAVEVISILQKGMEGLSIMAPSGK